MAFENGGYQGASLNTKLIYSRFHPYLTYRDEENINDINICEFYNYGDDLVQKLLIGTQGGRIKVVNVKSGKQILAKGCHIEGITHIQTSRKTPVFITSDRFIIGRSCLWNFLENDLECLANFYFVLHLEYGKRSTDKLIATMHGGASLFDIETHTKIQSFFTEDQGHNYRINKATLNYLDELVLSDGLIFDVQSGTMIHKLTKSNSLMNGLFHPNGREIILNSEIWDIRTLKLLRTVAGLNSCKVIFNELGTVIYAVPYNKFLPGSEKNCFYTFDAHNYNVISTVDVKRRVSNIAADRNDQFVCTVEAIRRKEFMCKLYEVGRTKQAGDENDGEESGGEEDGGEEGSEEDGSEEDDDDGSEDF